MAHVEKFVNVRVGSQTKEASPVVIVDAVRWWTPKSTESVDFTEVKEYIQSLKHRGFNVKCVTFDRWNSHDMMQQLNAYGMPAEILSVAKKHYEDMALVLMEERLHGPHIPLLIDELLQLRIIRDKVDHPRKGSKDLADAVCGAVFNAISRTPTDLNQEISIMTYDYEDEQEELEALAKKGRGVIELPHKKEMPDHLRDFMGMNDDDDGGMRFVDNFTML